MADETRIHACCKHDRLGASLSELLYYDDKRVYGVYGEIWCVFVNSIKHKRHNYTLLHTLLTLTHYAIPRAIYSRYSGDKVKEKVKVFTVTR